MSYVTAANRPNPAAMMGALGMPGAFGVLLVFGLAVTTAIPEPDVIVDTWDVVPDPEVIPDPVEPETASSSTEESTQLPEFTNTRPETDFDFEMGSSDPIGELPNLGEELTGLDPVDFGIPDPRPTPMFDPVLASPRGNPGRWITDNDYRASWINRGYSGVAGFALEISANGRVSDCQITRSTGHTVLDNATCRLLQDRARFNPAKDSSGNAIPGSYSSSVNWQIPE